MYRKKNILITGGSKGLGLEIVKEFSNQDDVYVFSRNKRSIKKNVFFLSVDLSDEKSTLKTLTKLRKKIDKIDLIISCAGSGTLISKDELKKKVLLKYFDTNFFSFSNLINSYLKVFRFAKTNIVVISSISGKRYLKAPIGYSLAKSNLNYLVKILAKKLAPYKIIINLITLGNILIKGNNWSKKLKKNPKMIKKYIKENVPLNNFIYPNNVISLIKYLSYNSKSITGSDFVIDGGQLL